MNQDIVKGKWKEIKGEVQKAWGKLTSDEIDKTQGDLTAMAGLVQQRYGENKEQFEKKLSGIVDQFNTAKDSTMEGAKDSLRTDKH